MSLRNPCQDIPPQEQTKTPAQALLFQNNSLHTNILLPRFILRRQRLLPLSVPLSSKPYPRTVVRFSSVHRARSVTQVVYKTLNGSQTTTANEVSPVSFPNRAVGTRRIVRYQINDDKTASLSIGSPAGQTSVKPVAVEGTSSR